MRKRGISVVQAVFFILMVTIAGSSVLWWGILPMLKGDLSFEGLESKVTIVTTRGYTLYDSSTGVAIVQVKRDPGESSMEKVRVLFEVDGNTLANTTDAPDPGQSMTYSFNLVPHGEPNTVAVVPIFVSEGGEEKEGPITSKVNIPSGSLGGSVTADYEVS